MHAEFCEICGSRRGEDGCHYYLDGKEVCLACSYKASVKESREYEKNLNEYQKVLAVALENEKRARGGGS